MVSIDKDFLMQIYLEAMPNFNDKNYSQEVIWRALEFFLEEIKSMEQSKFSLQIIHSIAKFKLAEGDTKSFLLCKEIMDEIRQKA